MSGHPDVARPQRGFQLLCFQLQGVSASFRVCQRCQEVSHLTGSPKEGNINLREKSNSGEGGKEGGKGRVSFVRHVSVEEY